MRFFFKKKKEHEKEVRIISHLITDCYFALQMKMSVVMVLLLADCKRSVKIPQGFTNAHALGVLSPKKKTAKI